MHKTALTLEKGEKMSEAKKGNKVRVHYHGTLDDGSVFSSTYDEKEPFEFTIGEGSVLPKFEDAIIGMKIGDKKIISLPPEHAYGMHKQEFVFVMNKAQAPASLTLEIGKRIHIRTSTGATAIATIAGITEDSVILDANDPLAGKALTFEIELVEIIADPAA